MKQKFAALELKMDNLIIAFRSMAKVTRTMASFKAGTTLTQQQLLITTDKSTATITKEKVIIILITSFATTPTWNSVTTINGNSKRMIISNLVKTRNNRLTTTPIKHVQQHLI